MTRAQDRMKAEGLTDAMVKELREVERRYRESSPMSHHVWFNQSSLKALMRRGLVFVDSRQNARVSAKGTDALKDLDTKEC